MRTDTLWRLTSLSDSEEQLLEESELDEEEEEEDEERLTKTQWEQGSLDLRLDFWWQSGKLEKKQLSIWDVCVFVCVCFEQRPEVWRSFLTLLDFFFSFFFF